MGLRKKFKLESSINTSNMVSIMSGKQVSNTGECEVLVLPVHSRETRRLSRQTRRISRDGGKLILSGTVGDNATINKN